MLRMHRQTICRFTTVDKNMKKIALTLLFLLIQHNCYAEVPLSLSTEVTDKSITLHWDKTDKTVLLYRKLYNLPMAWNKNKSATKVIEKGEKIAEIKPGINKYIDINVKANVRYYYRLAYIKDKKEILSQVSIASLKDLTAPAAVKLISANVIDDSHLSLGWNASASSDVVAYRIYRSQKNTSPKIVKVLQLKNIKQKTISTDIIQKKNTQIEYTYSIAAVDGAGNVSKLSNAIAIRLPDNIAPQSPLQLSSKQTGKGIELRWLSNNESDTPGYFIYRKKENTSKWVKLKPSLLYAPVFTDKTIQAGEKYRYRVTAVDSFNNESKSTRGLLVYVSSKGLLLPSPEKLSVRNNKKGYPKLNWTFTNNQKISGLIVLRNDGNGYAAISKLLNKNTYTDNAVNKSLSYKYKVQAISLNGQKSSASNEIIWHGDKP